MDMYASQVTTDSLGRRGGPRWRWPEATKRKIVEETFEPGASVAVAAQRYELNPNVVFAWRRLYRAGEFGKPIEGGAELVPVKVIAPTTPGPKRVADRSGAPATQSDSIEVRLAEGAQVRFSGALAREALREIIAAVFVR